MHHHMMHLRQVADFLKWKTQYDELHGPSSNFSTKSTKVGCGANQMTYQRTRYPLVSPAKGQTKFKDRIFRKKKSNSEKIIRNPTDDMAESNNTDDCWRSSVMNHVMDSGIYKNHQRIRSRFPFPLPTIREDDEPEESEVSDSEEVSKESLTESVNHSFTLLPSGDQNHVNKGDYEIHYTEQVLLGPNPLPEELQRRHLTRTSSGTLIWVGNDAIHNLVQKKGKKGFSNDLGERLAVLGDRAISVENKLSALGDKITGACERSFEPIEKSTGGRHPIIGSEHKSIKQIDDTRCSGEGEDHSVKSKLRKSKVKKTAVPLDAEDNVKGKYQDSKAMSKASSSTTAQDEAKPNKKFGEKLKKPKKFNKKQSYTLVTSKPLV